MPETSRANKNARRDRVSKKIAKVKRDSPGLSNKQAAGKAFGILRQKKKRG